MKCFVEFKDTSGYPVLIDPFMVFCIQGSQVWANTEEGPHTDIISSAGQRHTVKGSCIEVRDKMYAEINKGLAMTSPWNICPQVSADEKKAP